VAGEIQAVDDSLQHRRAVVGKLAGRRTVKRLFARNRAAGRGTTQRIGQQTNPAMQFVINASKLSPAFKLIRREAKTGQHDHRISHTRFANAT